MYTLPCIVTHRALSRVVRNAIWRSRHQGDTPFHILSHTISHLHTPFHTPFLTFTPPFTHPLLTHSSYTLLYSMSLSFIHTLLSSYHTHSHTCINTPFHLPSRPSQPLSYLLPFSSFTPRFPGAWTLPNKPSLKFFPLPVMLLTSSANGI